MYEHGTVYRNKGLSFRNKGLSFLNKGLSFSNLGIVNVISRDPLVMAFDGSILTIGCGAKKRGLKFKLHFYAAEAIKEMERNYNFNCKREKLRYLR